MWIFNALHSWTDLQRFTWQGFSAAAKQRLMDGASFIGVASWDFSKCVEVCECARLLRLFEAINRLRHAMGGIWD
ncbi:MAG: hypothetical protein DMG89_13645 [Acidobacteria bacterium]|nr:MAG: hypothetical protein DMG89_13645 [Acidobacteriota bacterium]